jgi:hypothetical protein
MREMNRNDQILHRQLQIFEKINAAGMSVDDALQQKNDRLELASLSERNDTREELDLSDEDLELLQSLVDDEYVEEDDDDDDCCDYEDELEEL